MPGLAEIRLSGNGIRGFGGDGKSPIKGFPSLITIDLSGNALSNWEEIWRLRFLPSLGALMLNGNGLSSVSYDNEGIVPVASECTAGCCGDASSMPPPPPGSSSSFAPFNLLHSISLSENPIASWSSVHALNDFPNMASLRLQKVDVLNGMGPGQARATVIARVGCIQVLNAGLIRSKERMSAEKTYLKSALREALHGDASEWSALSDEERELVRAKHPRVEELLKVHGDPSVAAMSSGAGYRLAADIVSVEISSRAADSVTMKPKKKRLPLNMSVQQLKRLASRLFKVPVSEIRAYYKEDGDFAVPIAMDSDLKTIAFYGVQDGGHILVDDGGSVRDMSAEAVVAQKERHEAIERGIAADEEMRAAAARDEI